MNIGWPEGIYIALVSINLLCSAAIDGEPKTGTNKFAFTFAESGIIFGLLYWGGFFA